MTYTNWYINSSNSVFQQTFKIFLKIFVLNNFLQIFYELFFSFLSYKILLNVLVLRGLIK